MTLYSAETGGHITV